MDHDIRECSLNSGLHFKQDSECYDGCSTARKYIITVACRSKWTNIDEACKGGKAEGSVPTLDPEAIWTVGLRPEGSVRIQQGFRTQRNPHSPPGWIAVGPNGLVPSVSNSAQTKFINLGYVIMSMKTKIQISIEVNQELKRHYSDTLPNIFYAHHTLTYYNSWLHKLLRVPKGDQKVIELSFDILNDWKAPRRVRSSRRRITIVIYTVFVSDQLSYDLNLHDNLNYVRQNALTENRLAVRFKMDGTRS